MSRRLFPLALALPLLLAVVAQAEPGGDSRSVHARQPGPFAVGTLETRLVDSSRPTAPNHGYKGAADRTFETRIWYPAERRSFEVFRWSVPPVARAGEPHPLIIYSHGFMSFNTEGQYLAEHLASLGYIVVAANYPLTNYFAPGGPNISEVVSQPGDVAFLITTVLGWNADPSHPFAGAVDPNRIGVVGVSLGGMTSTLATFHPRLRDPRIAAAVSIAGPSSMFGPAFYQANPKPYLMVAGDIDALVGYDANARNLQDRAPFATLVTVKGASHTGHADISALLFGLLDNADSVGCPQLTSHLADLPSPEKLFAGLGGSSDGIVPADPTPPCPDVAHLPKAMRPAREHDLVTLAVTSFFQSQFADSPADRDAFTLFLREVLPSENPEVTVSPPRPPAARAAVVALPVKAGTATPAPASAPH